MIRNSRISGLAAAFLMTIMAPAFGADTQNGRMKDIQDLKSIHGTGAVRGQNGPGGASNNAQNGANEGSDDIADNDPQARAKSQVTEGIKKGGTNGGWDNGQKSVKERVKDATGQMEDCPECRAKALGIFNSDKKLKELPTQQQAAPTGDAIAPK